MGHCGPYPYQAVVIIKRRMPRSISNDYALLNGGNYGRAVGGGNVLARMKRPGKGASSRRPLAEETAPRQATGGTNSSPSLSLSFCLPFSRLLGGDVCHRRR